MTAMIVPHESNTSPGGTIKVSVWVWSTKPSRNVTATVVSSAHASLTPTFTLCPVKHGSNCTIGALPANQAFELIVTDPIRPTAKIGRPIALAVTVSATGVSPAEAAVAAVVGQGIVPPTSPPPIPPTTLIPVPGTTITPGGLSGLFPTVTPLPSPSATPSHSRKLATVAQTSSALPLDSRLIGGQLAGLAVLAAAITMVVARLSLRTAQAPAGSGGTGAGGTSSGGTDTDGTDTGTSLGDTGTGAGGTATADAGSGATATGSDESEGGESGSGEPAAGSSAQDGDAADEDKPAG